MDEAVDEALEQAEDAPELEQPTDLVVDILTGKERPPTEKEHTLQRMIQVLAAEYHFPLDAMERDVTISTVSAEGKRRSKTADLVIYEVGQPH